MGCNGLCLMEYGLQDPPGLTELKMPFFTILRVFGRVLLVGLRLVSTRTGKCW